MPTDLSATALPLSAGSATAETVSAMASRGHDASVQFERGPAKRSSGRTSAARAGKEVLALEGISLSFGGVKALSDVDLSVNKGEIRAVIGPNGAGKSSLINVISGLYRPTQGHIHLCGHTFSSVPTRQLA